jgi:hypothetical protein
MNRKPINRRPQLLRSWVPILLILLFMFNTFGVVNNTLLFISRSLEMNFRPKIR